MYHRHSTSSTGSGARPQHHQQQYPFERAASLGSRPKAHAYTASENNNTSSSSLSHRDGNYFGNNTHDNYSSSSKYYKRSNNNSMSLHSVLVWRVLPFLICMLLPWIPTQHLRSQLKSKRMAIENLLLEQQRLVKNLDKTTADIQSLKLEVELLHKDNELSFQELRKQGKAPSNLAGDDIVTTTEATNMESDAYASLEEDEEILVNRIDRLEKEIQQRAVERLSAKYGNGQYRFRANVRDTRGILRYFIIETAMLAEMPHAIDHFFKMIEQKLWDGLALVHEPHSLVVSANPETTDETHAWAGKRFVDANITHMAFTEHSPTYPPPHHRMYTVSFSGRPGGPGFYISLDNEVDYKQEQESTFGVVMEGRDVLYQLFLQKDMGRKKILTIEGIEFLETKRPQS